jgi:hypothetical protein
MNQTQTTQVPPSPERARPEPCCDSVLLSTCCPPEAKSACCGYSSQGGCGCQAGGSAKR